MEVIFYRLKGWTFLLVAREVFVLLKEGMNNRREIIKIYKELRERIRKNRIRGKILTMDYEGYILMKRLSVPIYKDLRGIPEALFDF